MNYTKFILAIIIVIVVNIMIMGTLTYVLKKTASQYMYLIPYLAIFCIIMSIFLFHRIYP